VLCNVLLYSLVLVFGLTFTSESIAVGGDEGVVREAVFNFVGVAGFLLNLCRGRVVGNIVCSLVRIP
jgi:hypothetical protein